MTVWLNGALVAADAARIDPADRGFTLGDGLFETIRVADGRTCHLDLRAEQVGPPDAAAIGATLAGYFIAREFLEVQYSFDATLWVVGLLGGGGLVAARTGCSAD